MTVAEGDTLKLGAATLHFYVTPGHTPGTLTTVFDVTDGAAAHRVALYGGFRPAGATPKGCVNIASRSDRFAKVRLATLKVDTIIANHQTQDESRTKLEELDGGRLGSSTPMFSALPSRRAFSSCRQSVVELRSAGWGLVAERNASIRLSGQGPGFTRFLQLD